MTMFAVLPILLIISEFVWQKIISYPPSLEQIKIGVDSFWMLWTVRFLSFLLIATSLYLVSTFISKGSKKYYWLLASLIPLISLIYMSHPLDALKVFLVTLVLYISQKILKSAKYAFAITAIAIVFLNIFAFKEKPGIVEDLSLPKAQEELTFRFMIEDNIKPGIKFPLSFRRIAYNKYFVVIKNVSNEIISFFDVESLFFQEIHPMGQKAFVIFFWPQIFVFGISLFYITNKINRKSPKNNLLLVGFLGLSIIYFLTSGASTDRRQILTAITIVLVIAEGMHLVLSSKNKYAKRIMAGLIIMTIYGWVTNIYDRSVRPDFWLDNRPIAYDFVLKTIKDKGLTNYSKIVVPDTLYATHDFCSLYLDDCSKIVQENFNLEGAKPELNTLYVGFTGNFMGPNSENSKIADIEKHLTSKDMTIFGAKYILNNIASGFGQDLVISGVK